MEDKKEAELLSSSQNSNKNGPQSDQRELSTAEPPRRRPTPKRFVKNQIPESITANAALNAAIALLPSNYNFEVHKCVWRVLSTGAKRVALQFPEGLLMYSLVLSDILFAYAAVDDCFVLGDVTYGACCVDDLSALALGADLLIHYGHSCLVPIDATAIPCLYVFVDIGINVNRLINAVKLNFTSSTTKQIVLAGTIQFAAAIRAAKPELESAGFRVLVPQSKPLSAGEVLGCTAPTIPRIDFNYDEIVVVFVADGRFHLEAFMIANPRITAFRYDPYIGSLFLEEYDHKGMKESRRNAIVKAREAKNWGIVLGTLGRQGNPRILDRLEKKMREKGLDWTVVLMSELSPTRIALFGESVDAWVQIACPRLSIDWGDAFVKPLLTPFEAEIALGDLPGWWEREPVEDLNFECKDGLDCSRNESCCACNNGDVKEKGESAVDYPMDYYAQDGGEWNSCYSKKQSRPIRRNLTP
ncbi:Diphthamide biosynthesis protein [Actinidia chinensis var. chinensis]|uniref:2-(3-amino-3-carboxypropyl)histidine synthase subunit 1 n=1 Tax=Actinidia chinensis var. chinensis TaxID=1590841 RepID=A0A2R6Q3S5_ACTCC|nr:Diphthamide biosynthesis protein [Actinidia chinensis var. chinensis]